MGRGKCNFRKTDVTRAVKAATAGGVNIRQIEVDIATGKITLIVGSADTGDQSSALDEWLAKHARET